MSIAQPHHANTIDVVFESDMIKRNDAQLTPADSTRVDLVLAQGVGWAEW